MLPITPWIAETPPSMLCAAWRAYSVSMPCMPLVISRLRGRCAADATNARGVPTRAEGPEGSGSSALRALRRGPLGPVEVGHGHQTHLGRPTSHGEAHVLHP